VQAKLEDLLKHTSVGSAAAALKYVRSSTAAAAKQADIRYTHSYALMAVEWGRAETNLYSDAENLGRAELLDVAVKHHGQAAQEHAAETEVARARTAFAGSLIALSAVTRAVETRLIGDAAVVSGEAVGHKRARIRVMRRVTMSVGRLVNKAMSRLIQGKGPAVLTKARRQAAARLLAARAVKVKAAVDRLHDASEARVLPAARDLTSAARNLYEELAAAQHAGHAGKTDMLVMTGAPPSKAQQHAQTQQRIVDASNRLQGQVTLLTNLFVASAAHETEAMRVVSGVDPSAKEDTLSDTAKHCVKQQTEALRSDLKSALLGALTLGEAQAKQRDDRVRSQLTDRRLEMQDVLSQQLETVADSSFAAVPRGRKALARNYLAFKSYVATAGSDMQGALSGRQNSGLGSLGDLMQIVSARAKAPPPTSMGIGMGEAKMAPLFFGASKSISPEGLGLEALVNEFALVHADVRSRWRSGLGLYVLQKLETAMMGDGVLVTRRGNNGIEVFVNGEAVGLDTQLSSLKDLAVPMGRFTAQVAKSEQGAASGAADIDKAKPQVFVSPPEWKGN